MYLLIVHDHGEIIYYNVSVLYYQPDSISLVYLGGKFNCNIPMYPIGEAYLLTPSYYATNFAVCCIVVV